MNTKNISVTNSNLSKRRLYLAFLILILVLITLAGFFQVRNYQFLNYDDRTYILKNVHIINGLNFEGIWWAFSANYSSNWHPLTWLVYMVQYHFLGANPGVFHLINLFFHVLNVLLCFTIFNSLTKASFRSFVVAALFAIHPMHIQSVAWISELKDVLSTFFAFLSIISYAQYAQNNKRLHYGLSLVFLVASLLSKQMYVTLPFVFLLLDYWPLKRLDLNSFSKRTKEKILFFAVALLAAYVAYWAQKTGNAVVSLETLPLHVRASNSLFAYIQYILKFFFPMNLSIFYPMEKNIKLIWILISFTVLFLISFVYFKLKKKYPYLIVGWLLYLGTLVPVIGFVQIGIQAIADRYTYFPYLGLFLMMTWGISDLFGHVKYQKQILTSASLIVIVLLTAKTYYEIKYWKDTTSLFRHALKVAPKNNEIAYHQLGTTLYEQGAYQEAESAIRESLKINPDLWDGYNTLGLILDAEQKDAEAIKTFKECIKKNPNFAPAYHNLGTLYYEQGNQKDATYYFQKAVVIKPDLIEGHYMLALMFWKNCDLANAEKYVKNILEINPKDKKALAILANIEGLSGSSQDEKTENCKDAKQLQEILGLTGLVKTTRQTQGTADLIRITRRYH